MLNGHNPQEQSKRRGTAANARRAPTALNYGVTRSLTCSQGEKRGRRNLLIHRKKLQTIESPAIQEIGDEIRFEKRNTSPGKKKKRGQEAHIQKESQ